MNFKKILKCIAGGMICINLFSTTVYGAEIFEFAGEESEEFTYDSIPKNKNIEKTKQYSESVWRSNTKPSLTEKVELKLYKKLGYTMASASRNLYGNVSADAFDNYLNVTSSHKRLFKLTQDDMQDLFQTEDAAINLHYNLSSLYSFLEEKRLLGEIKEDFSKPYLIKTSMPLKGTTLTKTVEEKEKNKEEVTDNEYNFYYTLGNSDAQMVCRVTLEDGVYIVEMKYYIQDFYDFSSKDTNSMQYKMNELHLAGKAKGFEVQGECESVYIWQVGKNSYYE